MIISFTATLVPTAPLLAFMTRSTKQSTIALPKRGDIEYKALMKAIEEKLRTCDCSGHYKHDSPRWCHYCLKEVIINESGIDLWPVFFDINVDERDPTEEEQKMVDEFYTKHVRTENIWR